MEKLYEKDDLKLFAGVVKEGPKVIQKDGKKSCSILLEDRHGETIRIYFNNNPDDNSKKAQMSDRAEAGIKVNHFLTVYAVQKEGKTTATGLDFKYQGLWRFKHTDESGAEKEICVICGLAIHPKQVKEGIFSVSIPVEVWNKDTKSTDTIWYNVGFVDSKDTKTKMATIAEKVFTEDKTTCAIRCGAETIREGKDKDGNPQKYYNLWGYKIEAVYKE